MSKLLTTATPNHALQRTAPRVTVAELGVVRRIPPVTMKAASNTFAVLLIALYNASADGPVPPKPEIEVLREQVARLNSRVAGLETILRAKGLLPPPKAEKPEAWVELQIQVAADGKPSLDGKPATYEELKTRVASIFESGKFPEATITAPKRLSFPTIEQVLTTLSNLGVPVSSISMRD